jgi:hypothetical protein
METANRFADVDLARAGAWLVSELNQRNVATQPPRVVESKTGDATSQMLRMWTGPKSGGEVTFWLDWCRLAFVFASLAARPSMDGDQLIQLLKQASDDDPAMARKPDTEKLIRITSAHKDGAFNARVIRAALMRGGLDVNANVMVGEWELVLLAEQRMHQRFTEAVSRLLCEFGIYTEVNGVQRSNAKPFTVITSEEGETIIADEWELSGGLVLAMDVWQDGHGREAIWLALKEGVHARA